MLKRYFVTLSTFAGIVPGASHWMANVHWYEYLEWQNHSIHKRDFSHQFNTRYAAVKAAIRWVRKQAADDQFVLLEGSQNVLDPKLMRVGPVGLKRVANALWRRFEKFDGYNAKGDALKCVEDIQRQWEDVLRRWNVQGYTRRNA